MLCHRSVPDGDRVAGRLGARSVGGTGRSLMVVGAPADCGAARRRRRPCARHTTSHSDPSLRIDLKLLQELLANGARLIEVLPRTGYGEEHLPGATSLPS